MEEERQVLARGLGIVGVGEHGVVVGDDLFERQVGGDRFGSQCVP
jgi:hypothetical protein